MFDDADNEEYVDEDELRESPVSDALLGWFWASISGYGRIELRHDYTGESDPPMYVISEYNPAGEEHSRKLVSLARIQALALLATEEKARAEHVRLCNRMDGCSRPSSGVGARAVAES